MCCRGLNLLFIRHIATLLSFLVSVLYLLLSSRCSRRREAPFVVARELPKKGVLMERKQETIKNMTQSPHKHVRVERRQFCSKLHSTISLCEEAGCTTSSRTTKLLTILDACLLLRVSRIVRLPLCLTYLHVRSLTCCRTYLIFWAHDKLGNGREEAGQRGADTAVRL